MSNKLNVLNAGQVLGRSEMKKIMAGSGSDDCKNACEDIARECFDAPYFPGQMLTCTRQLNCCYAQCRGHGC